MQTTATETVPGREVIEVLAVARGNTVEPRNIGRDFTQSLRNVVGYQMTASSELLSMARDEAIARTEADASEVGPTRSSTSDWTRLRSSRVVPRSSPTGRRFG